MIDILTREPIGTQYEVETELPVSYASSGCPSEALLMKCNVRRLPHVQNVDFKVRYHNHEPYVVAIITVDTHADNSFLWQDIEAAFNEEVEGV